MKSIREFEVGDFFQVMVVQWVTKKALVIALFSGIGFSSSIFGLIADDNVVLFQGWKYPGLCG